MMLNSTTEATRPEPDSVLAELSTEDVLAHVVAKSRRPFLARLDQWFEGVRIVGCFCFR